jgi:nucleoside phosphorylase
VTGTLRALVVDDDESKLQIVSQALNSACASEVTTARSVVDALKWLESTRFDLLVLDVALPMRGDGHAEMDGGTRVLESLFLRPDRYNVPSEIVGLTAYQEALDAAADRFASHRLTMLLFHAAREGWVKALGNVARRAASASPPESAHLHRTDLVVLTALMDPEMQAITSIPWGWEPVHAERDHSLYWEGRAKSGRSVVAALCGRPGLPHAAIAAVKAIELFAPKVLVLCGVMAGVKSRVGIGDVVVADSCWDWGSGKWAEPEGSLEFRGAARHISINVEIRERVRRAMGDHVRLSGLGAGWRGQCPDNAPRVRLGPVASGASVVASKAVLDHVITQQKDVLGLEMEGFGVACAGEECRAPRPRVVIMKSVCDFGDHTKDDRFQAYASHCSAHALELLIDDVL